ncbi:MAG: DUF1624 domain-containing protein [Candidatus Micrarchaeota archaeon]|nr:DUF1624 domain-containing protein [Candidatus Micrarchaeota archaeon]
MKYYSVGHGKKRFWEIDFLRGIAIVMMIVYHILFDMNYFDLMNIDLHSLPIFFFARSIPVIFIMVAGISFYISYERASGKMGKGELLAKYIKRGAWIFSWGLIITITSWIFVPEEFIVFGILHFIGISIILSYPLLGKDIDYLLLASASIILGAFLLPFASVNFPYLLWLGFVPKGFHTLDYFPIFPWIGFMFAGMHIGKTFYRDGKRQFRWKNAPKDIISTIICFLGRHSLLIYILHQLVILSFLYLFLL